MQKIFDLLASLRNLFTDKAHELLTAMADELHALQQRVDELEDKPSAEVDTRPDVEPVYPSGVAQDPNRNNVAVTPTATPAEVAAVGGPQGVVSEADTARVDAARDSDGHTGSGTHDASVVVAADAASETPVLPVVES